MNSTSGRSCTRSVPESITGGNAAGQDSGDRYKSLLLMNRTTRFSDQPESADSAADLRIRCASRRSMTHLDAPPVVPDLYPGAARQGSNLRPLGEQRTVYVGCSTPTDLAEQGTGVYLNAPVSTRFTDEKVTAELGRHTSRAGAR